MRSIKNLAAIIMLALTLGMGVQSAQAGIILTSNTARPEVEAKQPETDTDDWDMNGIIIVSNLAGMGIILT